MGYEDGKVYKIQCEDGSYYFGSCITTLARRSYTHRLRSKTQSNRLYDVLKTQNWTIVLVEEVVCENRDQLRRVEDKHIQEHRNDPLCLNARSAVLNVPSAKEQQRKWYIKNRDRILAKQKELYHSNQ